MSGEIRHLTREEQLEYLIERLKIEKQEIEEELKFAEIEYKEIKEEKTKCKKKI